MYPLSHGRPHLSSQSQVIQEVINSFDPNVIVLQCGTDSLSGDKLGSLNLSMRGTDRASSSLPVFLTNM